MPRPNKCRKVLTNPDIIFFKPAGIPKRDLEEVMLTIDEFEAIRLADFEGLYHEKAAERMNISRQTFGNIISSARKKLADFIVNAKSLKITGGTIEIHSDTLLQVCKFCKHKFNTIRENNNKCPKCRNIEISEN